MDNKYSLGKLNEALWKLFIRNYDEEDEYAYVRWEARRFIQRNEMEKYIDENEGSSLGFKKFKLTNIGYKHFLKIVPKDLAGKDKIKLNLLMAEYEH